MAQTIKDILQIDKYNSTKTSFSFRHTAEETWGGERKLKKI